MYNYIVCTLFTDIRILNALIRMQCMESLLQWNHHLCGILVTSTFPCLFVFFLHRKIEKGVKCTVTTCNLLFYSSTVGLLIHWDELISLSLGFRQAELFCDL